MERNFIIMSTVLGVALGWFAASDSTECASPDAAEMVGDPPEDTWLGLSVITASGEQLGTVTGARMSDNGDVRCLRIKSLEFAGDDAGAFPNFCTCHCSIEGPSGGDQRVADRLAFRSPGFFLRPKPIEI